MAARALKLVLHGILLSSEGEKLNSMNPLPYMAPIAVVFLLPATLIMEENVVGITLALGRDDIKIIWYLLFNSVLAYFVNLTNVLVTIHMRPLALQVRTILSNLRVFNANGKKKKLPRVLEQVLECLNKLSQDGIKIWVLTAEKL